MIEDPTKPKGPSLELTLAKQANEAIENGADPHAATDMLGKMLTHLKQNPTVAQQGSEALAAGADPHAVSGKVWELANGKPMVSGGVAPQDKQFAALVGQGASLGFGAKILGGIDAANKMLPRALGGESAPASDFGKNYAATRDLIRNTAAEGIAAHPVAGRAVEGLSGVASSLPALAGGAVAKAPLLMRAIKGAATGAGFGATAGAGNATGGISDYARQIGTGAAGGAVVGAVAPEAFSLLGKGGSKAITALGLRPSGLTAQEMAADAALAKAPVGPQAAEAPSATPAANAIMNGPAATPGAAPLPTSLQKFRATTGGLVQSAGVESSKTQALRQLDTRLGLDNVSPADAISYADRVGSKPLAVLDLGGGNVAGLARTAKDVPSLARRMIPDFLNSRSAGTFGDEGQTLQRVTGDFENRIGLKPENYFQTADEMAAAQKAEAATNYGAVRKTVVDDPDVLSFLNEPEVRTIHKQLQRNARLRGTEAIPDLVKTSEVGGKSVEELQPQTMGTIDKMKRQLDQIIAGKAEGGTVDRDAAYAMRDRLNGILNRLDTQIPEYGQARSIYRGSAEAQDAFEQGRADFMKTDPRLIEKKLGGLPAANQDLYRRGAYDALRSQLLKMGDGANIGDWLEKNPDIRQRVAALAKNPDDAMALRGDLNVERQMGARKNFILGGPNTAERLIEHASTVPAATHVGNAVRALPGVGKLLGGLVDNSLTRRTAGQTGDVMSEVGKLMTRSGPNGIRQTMNEIDAMRALDLQRRVTRGRIANGVGGQVAIQINNRQ